MKSHENAGATAGCKAEFTPIPALAGSHKELPYEVRGGRPVFRNWMGLGLVSCCGAGRCSKRLFLDVSSGSDLGTADSGSACVSCAVFGVPPNTFQLDHSRKADHRKMNPGEGISEEVGRETRPTATGKSEQQQAGPLSGLVALPVLIHLCGNPRKTSRNRPFSVIFGVGRLAGAVESGASSALQKGLLCR